MLSTPDFREKQIILALLSHGDKLSFKNDNIIITDENKKIKHQSTCYRLFSLFVVGHLSITTGLLQRAKKFGFSIVFMNHSLKPYAYWNASAEGNVLLRKKQYNYDSLDIANRLVHNKIHNQVQVLQKIRNKESKLKDTITLLKRYKEKLDTQEMSLHEILGLEGIASKIYFQVLFKDCGWIARRPRAKMDMTNCLLDIGYTLLFNFIEGLINLYGFDIYKGVYHKEFYQRKSLVCDLIEPFRPLIDYRIRKAYKLNQIKPKDFILSQGQYRIFGKKSLPYLAFFIETILLNKKEMFKYTQSYYRSFIRNKSVVEYPYFGAYKEKGQITC
ncbi:MAG: type V CRISPR-associated endonuclease Cas1 [Bdellovibrionales bacterium]|nr:type V CRISPR-associated endonuclease Cas1 [Bdellovibrionales bacterium]